MSSNIWDDIYRKFKEKRERETIDSEIAKLNLEMRLRQLEYQMKIHHRDKETINVDRIINMLTGATITRESYHRIKYVLDSCLIVEEEERNKFDKEIAIAEYKRNLDTYWTTYHRSSDEKEDFIEEGEMIV